MLWIMKRSRPDLETTIGCLYTRMDKNGEDNWGKLQRVISYVKNTIEYYGIIGATDLHG